MICALGSAAGAVLALTDRGDVARRVSIAAIVLAALAGVVVAVRSPLGGNWSSLAASPLGLGGGALACTGAAVALAKARPASPEDVAGPLVAAGCAGAFLVV